MQAAAARVRYDGHRVVALGRTEGLPLATRMDWDVYRVSERTCVLCQRPCMHRDTLTHRGVGAG
jgi:hypothetical protein